MNNIMLDLETLSTEPDGFICAIGAVAFDASGVGLPFYTTIKNQEGNGVIDADTVFWWLKQSKEAQAAFENEESRCPSLAHALADFGRWMRYLDDASYVWGNGAASDNVWLRRAYLRKGLPVPWDFRNDMCYRTVKNLYSSPEDEPEQKGVHHIALDDAAWQAQHLINMNRRIGGLIL